MRTSIPSYSLTGDETMAAWRGRLHFEQVRERAPMYGFDIQPQVHEGLIQVLYLTKGGGEVLIDGRRWQTRAPSLIVVPSHHVHGFRFTPDVDGSVITELQRQLESLATAGLSELLPFIRRPAVIDASCAPRQSEALLAVFEALRCESHIQYDGDIGTGAGAALLIAVFVQIARISTMSSTAKTHENLGDSRKSAQVERFRALVDEHFRHRWTMEKYSAALNISPGHLTRLCRNVLGTSPLEVVNGRTLHEAKRELSYSTLTIKQLADWLGFADEAYFGRFFRKHTGYPPSDFRKAARMHLNRETNAQ